MTKTKKKIYYDIGNGWHREVDENGNDITGEKILLPLDGPKLKPYDLDRRLWIEE